MLLYRLLTVVAALFLLTLLPGTVQIDGVVRGQAWQGMLRARVGGRSVAFAFVEYRPGRIYYRLQVGCGQRPVTGFESRRPD